MANHPNRKRKDDGTRDARAQISKVFFENDDLMAKTLSVTKGPEGTLIDEISFLSVRGGNVIVVLYGDNNGWDYYVQGRAHKVDEIAADVVRALAVKETG